LSILFWICVSQGPRYWQVLLTRKFLQPHSGPLLNFIAATTALLTIFTPIQHCYFRRQHTPHNDCVLSWRKYSDVLPVDMTVPAIHRPRNSFWRRKTHALIACTHIAHKGKELRDVTANILDEKLLSEPRSVIVVGVGGEDIPVHKRFTPVHATDYCSSPRHRRWVYGWLCCCGNGRW